MSPAPGETPSTRTPARPPAEPGALGAGQPGAPSAGSQVPGPGPLHALFSQILRRLVVLTVVVTALAVVVGIVISGTAGLWGALVGGGVGVIFCLTTVASMILSEGRSPQFLALAVLGGWVVKMIVIIAILAVIRDLDFYDRYVLAGTLGTLVITAIVVEMVSITRARVPYVDTPSQGAPPPGGAS